MGPDLGVQGGALGQLAPDKSGGAPAGARSSSGVLRLVSVGRCNTARSDSNTDTVPILARRARTRGTAAWFCAQGMW